MLRFSSPSPAKRSIFCHRRGIENLVCCLEAGGQNFFHQTPGRRPPHFSGLRVNTVALGWGDGTPNERAVSSFHDEVVVVVDRSLLRTRDLADLAADWSKVMSIWC